MTISRKILFIVLGGATVLLLLATLFIKASSPSLTVSKAVLTGANYPQQVSASTLRYFTGSAFVEYDAATKATKPLTGSFLLPTVTDVKWGTDGALFKAGNYGSDQLVAQLIQAGLPTDTSYWWYVDFKTRVVSLVGNVTDLKDSQNLVYDIVWSPTNDLYTFLQIRTGQDPERVTYVYQATPGGTPRQLTSLDATGLSWANKEKLVYSIDTSSNHKLGTLDLKTLKAKTLINNFYGYSLINPAGTQGIVINSGTTVAEGATEPSGVLSLLDVASGALTQVAASFSGSGAWDATGNNWIALGNQSENKWTGYSGTNKNDHHSRSFSFDTKGKTPNDFEVIGLRDGTAYIQAEGTTTYAVAQKLPPIQTGATALKGQPDISGTTPLLTGGVGTQQVEGLKLSLRKYLISLGSVGEDVVLRNVVIQPHDPLGSSDSATFTIAIGSRPPLSGTLISKGLFTSRLVITPAGGGATIYDSGDVSVR